MTTPRLRHGSARGRPAGFTLVELLVAATLALVVMAALVSLFGVFGRAVADSQDLVQLAARMRSTAWRLRQDLQGLTTEVKPFIRPESAGGYFEIVEGPLADTGATMVADIDDVIMLTTASPGRPFTGLLSGSAPNTSIGFESPVAEVAWFCKQAPQPTSDGLQLFNLYRRQLLVAAVPGAGALLTSNTMAFTSWDAFYLVNELSARREGSMLVANSLADLTRRQCRFMHNPAGTVNPGVLGTWPQITTAAVPGTPTGTTEVMTGVREGEDLLLSNVIAFDVRAFDPSRPSGGAYVDLTAATLPTTAIPFTGMPAGAAVYDTWSLHTEFNNVADSAATQDQGTNLGNDNANPVLDDDGELEQRPPVTVPMRGIEIRIRCYEPSSQEVRQITVQHSFLAP